MHVESNPQVSHKRITEMEELYALITRELRGRGTVQRGKGTL